MAVVRQPFQAEMSRSSLAEGGHAADSVPHHLAGHVCGGSVVGGAKSKGLGQAGVDGAAGAALPPTRAPGAEQVLFNA
jgi:hypothetical protein